VHPETGHKYFATTAARVIKPGDKICLPYFGFVPLDLKAALMVVPIEEQHGGGLREPVKINKAIYEKMVATPAWDDLASFQQPVTFSTQLLHSLGAVNMTIISGVLTVY
jgi:hypothetical protein